MSFPEYTSAESHASVRLITRRVYDGANFIPMTTYKQQRRGTSTASPATNPPYPIVWVQRFEPMRRHRQKAKIKRTIESFLVGAEVLHADGVTDDTTVLQACINRAKALANANTFDADVVVSLTRTYLCNGIVEMNAVYGTGVAGVNQPLDPKGLNHPTEKYYLEITGPGGIMRTPMPNSSYPDPDNGIRFFPNLVLRDPKRLRLTSFRIASWRRQSAKGGRSAQEAQHGVWEGNNNGQPVRGEDFEMRNMTIEHCHGDGFQSFANGVRTYGCRFNNLGRLIASPWATDVDFYGNYCTQNSASIFDIETLGSTQMSNQVFRYNEFWNCRGVFMHIPDFPWSNKLCTASEGSTTLTLPGTGRNFADTRDLNREVKNASVANDNPPFGDGMQPDTIVVSIQSGSELTLSKPALNVTTAFGYRRFYSYIGSRLDGLEVRGNVRHCDSQHAFPGPNLPSGAGEVSMDAGGGVRLDGTKTLENYVWADNIWDRPNAGGHFWNLRRCDIASFSGNRGPWRRNFTGSQVVQMEQVTQFIPFVGVRPLTSAQVLAANPNIFEDPT